MALDTEKQVGMHLRNKNIENDGSDEDHSHGSECERVHDHIKWTISGRYSFVNELGGTICLFLLILCYYQEVIWPILFFLFINKILIVFIYSQWFNLT